jgi:uncharacterized membrane protein YsdA (DUF1294 family)
MGVQLTVFQWYFVIINILTFVMNLIEDHRVKKYFRDNPDMGFLFPGWLKNALCFLGGALGASIAYFVFFPGHIANNNAAPWAFKLATAVIDVVVVYSLTFSTWVKAYDIIKDTIPFGKYIVIYVLAINVIAFIAFGINTSMRRSLENWRFQDYLTMILAVLGGTIGAFFAVSVFDKKVKHYAKLENQLAITIIFGFQLLLLILKFLKVY